ncbi:MAG: LptF/LptG family permease [Candidatus Cloacimonetes bacterium]|nr:LptF/LptG family permease [Candidatus Cloacimonadota bacterium]MBS3767085.1 LptF/LptG family permease [Candidatus Cloacimonadota bacterium]
MKILSKYILKEHTGPFFLSIVIITFVMLLDRILDLLNLVITKHLGLFTTVKVFGLSLPFMLALSIPMGVLVASIMAFGRLASDNEITAFKASGINIYSMMKPVVIAAILLSIFMIYFNNNILPESNYALKNLLIKIHSRRPTSELEAGIFTKLKHYNFYFHNKDEETGLMHQIVIYDKQNREIPRMITAKKGNIDLYNGGNALTATLYDGEIYDSDEKNKKDYTAISFKKYKIRIPDLGIKVHEAGKAQRGDREMSSGDMQNKVENLKRERTAAIQKQNKYEKELAELKETENAEKNTQQQIKRTKHRIKIQKNSINNLTKNIYKYRVEIEKKYSIAFACLVFILIGAPIGMMTRAHSIGIGFAISTIIFVVYYISLYGGEELADRMIISPFIGMWISNIIFTIIGIYLIIYSVRERKIIHVEKIKNIFKKKKQSDTN